MPNWTFKIAETEGELAAAYRLRYETLGVELGDTRYCDHDQRLLGDEDDPMSWIVIASTDNQVIATMRVTALHHHAFIAHEVYKWTTLAELLSVTEEELRRTVARVDRGAVDREFRGTGLVEELQRFSESIAVQNGCFVVVGAVAVGNKIAQRAFHRIGWKHYAAAVSNGEVACDLIYVDLRN